MKNNLTQMQEVWEIAWSFTSQVVCLVHKTHGPEQWNTTIHEKYIVRISKHEYDRVCRRVHREHGRMSFADLSKAAYDALVSLPEAEKIEPPDREDLT